MKLDAQPKLIYTLSHPLTGEIVYVGSTQNLYLRLCQHVSFPTDVLKDWISDLKSKMLVPIITEVDRVTTAGSATAKEFYWINKLQEQGYTLLNKNGNKKHPARKPKREALKKRMKVDPELIIKWRQKRKREDYKILGDKRVNLSLVLRTGTCREYEFEILNKYYAA